MDVALRWCRLLGAKREHGLDIDYIGQWNERDAPEAYGTALRKAVGGSEVANKVLRAAKHPTHTLGVQSSPHTLHTPDTHPSHSAVSADDRAQPAASLPGYHRLTRQ